MLHSPPTLSTIGKAAIWGRLLGCGLRKGFQGSWFATSYWNPLAWNDYTADSSVSYATSMEGATCFLPEVLQAWTLPLNTVKSLNTFIKLSHRLFKGWNKPSAESRTPSVTNAIEISPLPFKGHMTLQLSSLQQHWQEESQSPQFPWNQE